MLSGISKYGRGSKTNTSYTPRQYRREHRTLVAGVYKGRVLDYGRTVDDEPFVIMVKGRNGKAAVEKQVALYAQQHGYTAYSIQF